MYRSPGDVRICVSCSVLVDQSVEYVPAFCSSDGVVTKRWSIVPAAVRWAMPSSGLCRLQRARMCSQSVSGEDGSAIHVPVCSSALNSVSVSVSVCESGTKRQVPRRAASVRPTPHAPPNAWRVLMPGG